MTKPAKKKLSFKQQMMLKREEVIIETVNTLLSTKGFDAMTVDEVADTVGIAKASLYRHFPSKEALGIAALLDIMTKTKAKLTTLSEQNKTAIARLKSVTRWAMRLKIEQQMPNLPSENSALTEQLKQNKQYVDGLIEISDMLGGWIEEAQEAGALDSSLPSIVILYTLYARACDPVLTFLKQGELYDDEKILDLVMRTCFDGIGG